MVVAIAIFLLVLFCSRRTSPARRCKVNPLRISLAGTSQPQLGSPVFMRVRENPPPFTLRLFEGFVNSKSRVSTGFLGFSSVFLGILPFLAQFPLKTRPGTHPHAAPRGSHVVHECRLLNPTQ
jgi:hypothetical protein